MFVVRRAKRGAPWETPHRITTDASSDPKWSPDGRLIAYSVNGELRVIGPDGTGQRVVVPWAAGRPMAVYPIWSSDSRTIYYKAYETSVTSGLWAVSVDGGAPRLLITFDDPARRSLRREFATDGRRFYFTIAERASDVGVMTLGPAHR